MDGAVRLFFAVDVPGLPPWAPGSSDAETRTAAAPTHLTLRFLGEQPEDRRSSIERAGAEATAGRAAFAIALRPIGAFPSSRAPRIVWLGVTTGREELVGLERSLANALAPLGVLEEDRPFVPHVTWRRVRSRQDAERARVWLEQGELPRALEGRVDALFLKESELAPSGARHRVLATFPLRGTSRPPQEGSRPTSS